jgi:Cys-rich repeat protein
LKDPRGWLLPAVAVASIVALLLAGRGRSNAKGGPGFQCLTHIDCAKALRCYALPKDDPFATFGTCVEPCLDDAQCGAGEKCAVTAKGDEQLVPVKVGLQPGERVCIR